LKALAEVVQAVIFCECLLLLVVLDLPKMSLTQFLVPIAGKAAAGSKRQLTAGDAAQDAPVAKASKQQKGRSWLDWQMSHCKEPREGVSAPWAQVDSSEHQVTAQLAKLERVSAESLLADLLTEDSWRDLIDTERKKPYFSQLESFLQQELDKKTVYPPRAQILRALNELPVSKVKVVIIGQVCAVIQLSVPFMIGVDAQYATLIHCAGSISRTRTSRRIVFQCS
jgi:hypothetical protein